MAHDAIVILKKIWSWRSRVIALVAPLLLSFFFVYDGTEYQQQARCAFVLLLLVIYWTSECVPIAVTGLLPMLLYPLLRIATAKELAPKYMSEVIVAFMASYILVISFERANLHKRLALKILKIVGPQPRWLLFGILMSASVLSMFTNNTVACALHLPIVKGIVDELRQATRTNKPKKKLSCYSLGDTPKGGSAARLSLPRRHKSGEGKAGETVTEAIPEAQNETELETKPEEKPKFYVNPNEVENSCADSVVTVETVTTDAGGSGPGSHRPSQDDSIELKRVKVSFDVNGAGAGQGKKNGHRKGGMLRPHSFGHFGRPEVDLEEEHAPSRKTITGLEKMLLIAAAYGASIGGTCTLIGTPTNLIMRERVEIVYTLHNCTSQPINFASWLIIGFPTGFIFIILAWFWFQTYFLGIGHVYNVWIRDTYRRIRGLPSANTLQSRQHAMRVQVIIDQLNAALEPMGFKQWAVLLHCIVLIVILITRQLSTGGAAGYIGWGIIAPDHVGESTGAMLVLFVMFIFPSHLPKMNDKHPPPPLLKWKQVEESFPFGVILLLGGGMAATYGATASGLPELVAPTIYNMLKNMNLSISVLIISIIVSLMTEVMSNVACVALLSPVVEQLAFELNVSPLLLMFPTALSASFAFMLPVGTPPNALIFSTNRLKLKDMALCGLGANVIGVFVVFLAVNTWGSAYFSLFEPLTCS